MIQQTGVARIPHHANKCRPAPQRGDLLAMRRFTIVPPGTNRVMARAAVNSLSVRYHRPSRAKFTAIRRASSRSKHGGGGPDAFCSYLLLGSDRGGTHHQLLKLGSLLKMSPSRGTQDAGRMRVTHEPCQFEAVLGLVAMITRRFHDFPTIGLSFGFLTTAPPDVSPSPGCPGS
jgi:hypothetical protein